MGCAGVEEVWACAALFSTQTRPEADGASRRRGWAPMPPWARPGRDAGAARAQADGAPGARDAEELIEVHRLGLPELAALMAGGDMLLPSVATCFLALERLRAQGLVD